jgi:hypothetical protein
MDYIIGAGAILESGENGTITPANLHAHVDAALAQSVKALAIDFESSTLNELSRLLIVAPGWNAATFRQRISEQLPHQQTCTLGDVLCLLGQSIGTIEVHVFAHWLPDDTTCAQLKAAGITIVCHPLESIAAAAVVSGQRARRWKAA